MEKPWKILVLVAVILNVDADPKCQGKTNVICFAGARDYVLERGLVSDNSATVNVTLSNCKITDVNYESFMNMPKLKYIDLSRNKITALKVGSFDEAIEITYFNISFNRITTLPVAIFDRMSKIEILDLKENQIREMSPVLFEPVKDLRYLDISNNLLVGKDLPLSLFDVNPYITSINFSGNDMSGTLDDFFSAFQVLKSLFLNQCSLDVVPAFATHTNLRTLKYLYLSGNRISNIDEPGTFFSFDDLIKLDLADNVIENLHEELFQPLKSLKVVILRNNKLKSISDKLFQNLPKLSTVVLSHNLLEVIPENAFKGNSLTTLILSYNRFTYLQDNLCSELNNSGSDLKKFLFHENPWQCACLRDVLKEVKGFNIEYDGAKYNGKNRVCATTEEFRCKRQETVNKFYTEIYDNTI